MVGCVVLRAGVGGIMRVGPFEVSVGVAGVGRVAAGKAGSVDPVGPLGVVNTGRVVVPDVHRASVLMGSEVTVRTDGSVEDEAVRLLECVGTAH